MYRRMSLLPGIAIIGILIIHGIAKGFDSLLWWSSVYNDILPINYDPLGTPQYFVFAFIKISLLFGVPIFYFVSGFFVVYAVGKIDGKKRWLNIKTRILSLLVPYLLWTIVWILINAMTGRIYNSRTYIEMLVFGLYGYFFIPILIMFYLLSPAFIYIAKKNWKLLLIVSGLIQFIYTVSAFTWLSFNSPSPVKDFFLSAEKYNIIFNWFFYFPFGVVFGLNIQEFQGWLSKYWKRVMVICIGLIASAFAVALTGKVYATAPESWTHCLNYLLIQTYNALVILVILGFLEEKNIYIKMLSNLSGLTFGIYLTHNIFIVYFTKFIYHVFPHLLRYQILFSVMAIIVGLSGSLFLITIVKKSPLRSRFRLIFG